MFKVMDIVNWAYVNRHGATADLTYHDFLEYFAQVKPPDGILPLEREGCLCGVVLVKVDHDRKLVDVVLMQVLPRMGLLKDAFAYFHRTYPGYTLIAMRRGKPITYFS